MEMTSVEIYGRIWGILAEPQACAGACGDSQGTCGVGKYELGLCGASSLSPAGPHIKINWYVDAYI